MSRQTLQQRQTGFSLIEVMVALTLGLMMLAGLVTLVVNTSKNYGEVDKASQQMEGGRFALDLLSFDLKHAGFYGDLASPAVVGLPAAMPDACSRVPATIEGALQLAVQGEDSPGATGLGCVNNHRAGTDILVIRRTAATVGQDINALTAGQLYLQSLPIPPIGGDAVVVDIASGNADDLTRFPLQRPATNTNPGPTPGEIRQLRTDIYYVSRCSSAACADTLPTLMRVELQVIGGALSWNTVPLVEGVENMQIDYWVDNDGDSIGDVVVTDPGSLLNWSRVVGAQISLLVRNIEPTMGYTDNQKTYNLGLTAIAAPGDAYRRHVYTTSVRLENPAARLEP